MKKVYLAPHTEAIKFLGENAIMAVSSGGGFTPPHVNVGTGSYNGGAE